MKTAADQKNVSVYKVIKSFTPYLFKENKKVTFSIMLVTLLMMALMVGQTILTANLFTSVEMAVGSGSYTEPILWFLGVLAIVLATPLLNGAVNLWLPDLWRRCESSILPHIHKKVKKLPVTAFEDPSMLDAINKAEVGATNGSVLVVLLLLVVFGYLPYFILMGAYLYTLKPILGIAPIIVFIPVLLGQIVKVKAFSELEEKSAPSRRRVEHYEKCVGDRQFFKETRLLGAFTFYRKLYRESIGLLNKEKWRAERKSGIIELLMKALTLIAYGFLLYLLVTALLSGDIAAGQFAAVFASIGWLFGMMEEMIVQNVGSALQEKGAAVNLIRLLEMQEREGDKKVEVDRGIELKDVRFTYPGSEKESIRGVSLTIRPGETLAVVGTNGAGKSTLVKLLMGLYTPTSGAVSIGGVDSREADPNAMFKNTSAVFQDFGRYKMTLERNIHIADLRKAEGIEKAAEQGDVDIQGESYLKGLDTMLSKEFDGVDVSGGQWQRIAIARGLFRNHDLIVLDEPTAAIDPLEETRVYKKFAEIAKENTAIIVTHRLGSCRIADRIAVMDSGELAELGTHDELMQNNGLYREMWDAQSEWLNGSGSERCA